jgi:hypothetical protein
MKIYLFIVSILILCASCSIQRAELRSGLEGIDNGTSHTTEGFYQEASIVLLDKRELKQEVGDLKLYNVLSLSHNRGKLPEEWGTNGRRGCKREDNVTAPLGRHIVNTYGVSCTPRFSYLINNGLELYIQSGLGVQYAPEVCTKEELKWLVGLGINKKISDRAWIGIILGGWYNISNGDRHEYEGDFEHYPNGFHSQIGLVFGFDF